MKRSVGFASGGLALGFAFVVAAFSAAPAAAGPFGATASIRDMSTTPIVDVQARRVRPVGRPGRPVARGRGRGVGVAAGLIGAAIVGGAIIANSQPRRRVYVDDGYYDGGDPYYGNQYYGGTGYVVQQPQTYYGGGGYYYQQPQVRRRPHYPDQGYYNPRVRNPTQPVYRYDPQYGPVVRQRGAVGGPGPGSNK